MKSIVLVCLCVASVWATPLKQQAVSVQKHLVGAKGRIVGGQVAKEGQFPWQVAVYFDTSDGTFFCGGALITPSWVLTSGHCTYHAQIFTLHLGANSLVTDDDNRLTIAATHSEVHPNYNPNSLVDDIGLIRIDPPVELNDHVRTIPISDAPLQGDESVIVSGWGASGDWDGVVNDLNYVALKAITNAQCKQIYGSATITDGMVCAVGETNEGTCDGDSGGPLVITESDGSARHVGIVSWASASGCETDHPSGYTRTSAYIEWIKSVIAGH